MTKTRCTLLLALGASLTLSACRFDGAGAGALDGGTADGADGPTRDAAITDVSDAWSMDASDGPRGDLADAALAPDRGADTAPPFAPPYVKSPEGWVQRAPLLEWSQYVQGLWSTGPDDVWVTAQGGGLLHYDGSAWRRVQTPHAAHLNAAWGVRRTDLWIVGDGGTILHFDGTQVQGVPSPTKANLTAIHGVAGAVWAAGAGIVLRREAAGWKSVTVPASRTFRGVYVASPTDVWISAEAGSLLHFAGQAFEDVPAVDGQWKRGLWGSSGADIWAGSNGAVAHYDGKAWSYTGGGAFGSTVLDAVHGESGEVWAAGGSKAWRLAGATWTQELDVPQASWLALRRVGNDVTYVAGYTRLHRGEGTRWHGLELSNGAWFNAVARAGGRLFVGGSSGLALLDEGHGLRSLTWHTPHSSAVQGLWVSPGGIAWLVTNDGRIARYDASADELVEEYDGSGGLRTIWGATPSALWAVGESGALLYSTGNGSWTPQTGAGAETWRAVWGTSSTNVYVVGGYGKISHYDGQTWTPVDTSALAPDTLYAIHGRNLGDIWVVGSNATVWHFDGGAWNEATPGGMVKNNDLRAVYVAPSGTIWIAANGDGVVYHGNGKTDWQHHLTGSAVSLFSLAGSGESDIWVAGEGGVLRHLEP